MKETLIENKLDLSAILELGAQVIERSQQTEDYGLYYGKTGALVALHKMAALLGDETPIEMTTYIQALQEEISDNFEKTDDSYASGIFGIGWAVSQLYDQGFIKGDGEEVLRTFDDEFYKLIMYQGTKDHNLELGTLGRINYYLPRTSSRIRERNKYQYLINMEIVSLLLEDFTKFNEVKYPPLMDETEPFKTVRENAAFFCHSYHLMVKLDRLGICSEILGRQRIELLNIFIKHYQYMICNSERLYTDEQTYWSALFILSALHHESHTSKVVTKQLVGLDHLLHSLLLNAPFTPKDIMSLSIQSSLFHSVNGHYLSDMLDEIFKSGIPDNVFETGGLNGLGGLLYLLSCKDHSDQDFVRDTFLI
jgi:hypothetical protein